MIVRIAPLLICLNAAGTWLGDCALANANAKAIRDDPVVQNVVAAIERFDRTIQTVSGRFHMLARRPGDAARSDTQRGHSEHNVYLVEFAADIHQPACAIDWIWRHVEPAMSPDRIASRTQVRFDGQRYAFLRFTPAESPFAESGPPADHPHSLNLGLGDEIFDQHYLPLDWCGLIRRRATGRRLPEALTDPAATIVVESPTPIGATICPTLVIRQPNQPALRLVCDPVHGYLPRRLQVASAPNGRDFDDGWKTMAFGRFGEDDVWFPINGTYRAGMNIEWEFWLDDLKVNEAIPSSEFSLAIDELPPGVKITEANQPTSYSGGRDDLFRERDRLLDVLVARGDEAWSRFKDAELTPHDAPGADGAATGFQFGWMHATIALLAFLLGAAWGRTRMGLDG